MSEEDSFLAGFAFSEEGVVSGGEGVAEAESRELEKGRATGWTGPADAQGAGREARAVVLELENRPACKESEEGVHRKAGQLLENLVNRASELYTGVRLMYEDPRDTKPYRCQATIKTPSTVNLGRLSSVKPRSGDGSGPIAVPDYLYLGFFGSEDQAARAHDLMSIRLHGDQAVTNFPHEDYKEEMRRREEISVDYLLWSMRRGRHPFVRIQNKTKKVVRYAGDEMPTSLAVLQWWEERLKEHTGESRIEWDKEWTIAKLNQAHAAQAALPVPQAQALLSPALAQAPAALALHTPMSPPGPSTGTPLQLASSTNADRRSGEALIPTPEARAPVVPSLAQLFVDPPHHGPEDDGFNDEDFEPATKRPRYGARDLAATPYDTESESESEAEELDGPRRRGRKRNSQSRFKSTPPSTPRGKEFNKASKKWTGVILVFRSQEVGADEGAGAGEDVPQLYKFEAYIRMSTVQLPPEAVRARVNAKKRQPDPECKEAKVAPSKRVSLGYFGSEDQAARAHDLMGIRLHGDQALTNFPYEDYKEEMRRREEISVDYLLWTMRRGRHPSALNRTEVMRYPGDEMPTSLAVLQWWEARLCQHVGRPKHPWDNDWMMGRMMRAQILAGVQATTGYVQAPLPPPNLLPIQGPQGLDPTAGVGGGGGLDTQLQAQGALEGEVLGGRIVEDLFDELFGPLPALIPLPDLTKPKH